MKFDKEWYDNLNKPRFQPPSWVFAPVWAVLYAFMFIAFGLVAAEDFKWYSIFAYLLFFMQLGVNISWTPVFFVEHNLRKAFLMSALLAFLVFLTMLAFFKISLGAGLLFIPYFLWCCFATVLCFEILERNEW